MATDDRQQTERQFVRSDDPNLTAEANAALTQELQQAIGAEYVSMPADAPDPATAQRSDDSAAKATVSSMRPLFIVTLLAALTVGAVIALSTGSWWALVLATAVHALGTMVVASGAIQLTTQRITQGVTGAAARPSRCGSHRPLGFSEAASATRSLSGPENGPEGQRPRRSGSTPPPSRGRSRMVQPLRGWLRRAAARRSAGASLRVGRNEWGNPGT